MFRLHVKYQKSTAARAQQFSAQRTGGNASGVQRVDAVGRDCCAGAALQLPGVVQQTAKFVQVCLLVGQDGFGFIHERQHLLQPRKLVCPVPAVVELLDLRRETGKSGKEHHQSAVQTPFALRRQQDWAHFVPVRAEINAVEAAERRRDLVLPSAGLCTEHPLQIDGLLGQFFLAGILPFQRVECVQHPDGK